MVLTLIPVLGVVEGTKVVHTGLFSTSVWSAFVWRKTSETRRVLCLTATLRLVLEWPQSPSLDFRVTPAGIQLLVDSVILELPQSSGRLKWSFCGRGWREAQMRQGGSSSYSCRVRPATTKTMCSGRHKTARLCAHLTGKLEVVFLTLSLYSQFTTPSCYSSVKPAYCQDPRQCGMKLLRLHRCGSRIVIRLFCSVRFRLAPVMRQTMLGVYSLRESSVSTNNMFWGLEGRLYEVFFPVKGDLS